MAIVEKRSVLSSSFLKGAGKTSLILNLEESFLVVIKERRNFYIAFLLWTYLQYRQVLSSSSTQLRRFCFEIQLHQRDAESISASQALDFPVLLELTADTLEIELKFPWVLSTDSECTEEHHGGEQQTSLEIKEACYNRRLQVTVINITTFKKYN